MTAQATLLAKAVSILDILDDTVLIGGLAVGSYGYQRTTKDVDLASSMPKDTIMNALHDKCDHLALRKGDMYDPLSWVIHGVIDGVEFQILHAPDIQVDVTRHSVAMNGTLRIASLMDIVKSKLFAGGSQDLNDVAILSTIHPSIKDASLELANHYKCQDKLTLFMKDERMLARYAPKHSV